MIVLDDLSYQYGTEIVLDALNLTIPDNSLTALVGRNGAGKSTLLRCIAGWTLPTEGDVLIHDVSLRRQESDYRQQIIFVPDTPDFYDELSAWEHVQFVAQLHQVSDWHAQAEMLFDTFQLSDQQGAYPFTFSRGMRYKLSLIMALIVSPPVLLLDEPFGPLDANARDDLWAMLRTYHSEGKTVLFSTHEIPDTNFADYGNYLHLQSQQIALVAGLDVESLQSLLGDG